MAELDKLIVDEVDEREKNKKQQESSIEAIQEEKAEEEVDTGKLS